jgi:hypothetical protein
MMKVLTLCRPWPWAIFHAGIGRKLIENRGWKPPESLVGTGHPLVIHAGQTWQCEGEAMIKRILGLSRLPDEAMQKGLIGRTQINSVASCIEEVPEDQRAWFVGPYAWLLNERSTVAFPEPIAFKGAQGIRELPLEYSNRISDVLLAMEANR